MGASSKMEGLMRGMMGGGGGMGGGMEDMKQAENVWKYLDELASKDPEEYQKFISGQMKEGTKCMEEDKAMKKSEANPEVWRVARATGELGRTIVVLMRACGKVAAPSSTGDDR